MGGRCKCVCLINYCSGGLGGKSALQPTPQEEFPASHANAGESDEDGERRAGGHAGPPAGAEERPAALAAESGGAQSCNGETGRRNEVNGLFPCFRFAFNQGLPGPGRMRRATPFQISSERFLDGTSALVKERDLRCCYYLSLQRDITTDAAAPLDT